MPVEKAIAEQDLLARENARLRGDLLTIGSRINHDLRTPLGGIVGTGEMLKEILAEHVPSSAKLVDSMFYSADEIARLIKQVSYVAKASASPVSKKTVSMGEIVLGVLQRLESRILKQHATVTEPDAWIEIEGVADWLEFIWWNFLTNSLQHGGPKIQLGWRQENAEIKFWITDNGGGVPVPERAKLFQPFDSLHQPDSARGLGLSVVQRLVELQDGRCGYESYANGFFFFFTLPHGRDLR
jgi:K+-sensing histidine kinase KdpD